MIKQRQRTSILFLLLIFVSIAFARGLDNEKTQKLHQLNRDIVLLNLINGLYLTTEQTESLIEKIETAEQIRENFFEELERRENQIGDVLEDVREVLLKGQEIPEDLKGRVHRMKEIQHRLEDERGEQLIRVESEVEELLTSNQRIVIDEYKPCTIPPLQGKIGQSVETAAQGSVRTDKRDVCRLSHGQNRTTSRFRRCGGKRAVPARGVRGIRNS